MKQTVLITGASRGIGAAAAKLFAAEGYRVAVCCHTQMEKAEELAASLPDAAAFAADIACEEEVSQMIDAVHRRFGEIHVLINNAGIAMQKLFTDTTAKDWSRIFDVNVTGMFYTCRAVLPEMIRRKSGRIVNVSSMWGVNGASCEAAYSASKAGVGGLTQALAKELARSKIPVNALACGVIDTEMNKQLDEAERAELAEDIPAGRFATPEEVAEMVWKLICAPEYLTGQIITFDGGYL